MSASVDAQSSDPESLYASGHFVFSRPWLRGAAVVRILFGVVWAFDATFKWLPGLVGGDVLPDELG